MYSLNKCDLEYISDFHWFHRKCLHEGYYMYIYVHVHENACMKDITGFSKDLYCHHMYIFTYLQIEV